MAQIQHDAVTGANLEDLDEYVEGLYEDRLEDRIRYSAMISTLFRHPSNLPTLLDNPALFGALARVLRDDWKKSIDLEIYIISAFFAVSLWSNLHSRLVENLVGKITVDIIELELRRASERTESEGIAPSAIANRVSEQQRGGGASAPRMSERERRWLGVIQKQDRLLYYCFYLLLNLAEDVNLERKMRRHNIVGLLMECLDRSNVDLLLVVTMFLKKLSIFEENKDAMARGGIIEKLARFVPVGNAELLAITLRLLHNLSFDANLRSEMVCESGG